jgi:steroid 5-alpha reductase family enzyme
MARNRFQDPAAMLDSWLTKIRLRYRFKTPPGSREKVDRALEIFAEECPAYQSVKGCIACTWEAIIETERDHRVITTGPYAVVRHPMYSGVILMFLGVPLMLGSVWGLIPVVAMAILLMIRSVLEERLLRRDLPGYEQYMGQTRCRIIPGIW